MDIQSQAAGRLYGAALQAAQPDQAADLLTNGEAAGGEGFVETVGAAAQETLATITQGEEMAKAMMAGKADAHSVVEALAATEMALEMAVTVRDRVVAAYQEILRMPV